LTAVEIKNDDEPVHKQFELIAKTVLRPQTCQQNHCCKLMTPQAVSLTMMHAAFCSQFSQLCFSFQNKRLFCFQDLLWKSVSSLFEPTTTTNQSPNMLHWEILDDHESAGCFQVA